MGEIRPSTEADSGKNCAIDVQSLAVDHVLARGRFSTIFKGHSNGHSSLAVKVFDSASKQAYYNERDLYDALKSLRHNSSFLLCYGAYEGISVNGIYHEFVLLQSCTEFGNLRAYLQNNTLTWSALCKMLSSIVQGIAALHCGFIDVTYCHRNVTSGNFLVKSDLTCCLSDFSLLTKSSRQNKLDVNVDLDFWYRAASVRYMAPEVLDGSLNAVDCETSLLQADIYSMGLVLWEVCRRCCDLYQGALVPEFELAYSKELGRLDASLDQMLVFVSKNRARPLFPVVWKNSNPAIQLMKETIEDSWDQDGEARLTASCILKRISELPMLWDRYKASHRRPITLDAVIPNNNSHSDSSDPNDMLRNKTTVKNINALSKQHPMTKIQPYQGKNPCIERNLMSFYESENKPLVERSSKHVVITAQVNRRHDENDDQLPLANRPPRHPPMPIAYVRNNFNGHSQVSECVHEASKHWFDFVIFRSLLGSKLRRPSGEVLTPDPAKALKTSNVDSSITDKSFF